MSVDTTDFIGNWSMGANNFAVDPPNAVLVIDDVEQRQDLAVIELYNPEYNSEASVLKYDIIAENASICYSLLCDKKYDNNRVHRNTLT